MIGQPARGPGRQRPRGYMPLVHLWPSKEQRAAAREAFDWFSTEDARRVGEAVGAIRKLRNQRKAERRRLRGAR